MNNARRRAGVAVVWVASVAAAFGAGWWSVSTATSPPTVDAVEPQSITAVVREGTVSSVDGVGVSIAWPVSEVGVNSATGTVTAVSLEAAGSEVDAGDIVYSVDLLPVVALQGAVPAFRDLTVGTSGADVAQVQEYLSAAGYLDGAIDGDFGAATRDAVDAWRVDLGLPAAGVVPASMVVFIDQLPARLAPTGDLAPGVRMSPGMPVLLGGSGEPAFTVAVLPESVATLGEGVDVDVDLDGLTLAARIERFRVDEADASGQTRAVLGSRDGAGPLCGADCLLHVPLGADAVVAGSLVAVPETTGPLVPAAAVFTDATGQTFVVLENESRRTVDVLASVDGLSVVAGVEVGELVVLNSDPGRS